jgi:hypothetical protein
VAAAGTTMLPTAGRRIATTTTLTIATTIWGSGWCLFHSSKPPMDFGAVEPTCFPYLYLQIEYLIWLPVSNKIEHWESFKMLYSNVFPKPTTESADNL